MPYFSSNLFGRVIFHSHLPKLDSLVFDTRAQVTILCPLIQIDQFCRKQWTRKSKGIKSTVCAFRVRRQKNWRIYNKRELRDRQLWKTRTG